MLLHGLVRPKTSSPLGKERKIFQSYENGLGNKRLKPEKHEALREALKKWLLILRSENVPVHGSLFKEKALEFTNKLNIEGFQASERWLKNDKNVFRFGNFQLIVTIAC